MVKGAVAGHACRATDEELSKSIDLANNSHATALHRRRALYSVGISGWYALTSHCGNSGSYGDPVFAIG